MNTCFHSTVPAPVSLPAIGTLGDYIMPAIIIDGKEVAPLKRYAVRVNGHIGTFGLRLQEVARPNFYIETHFTCFEPKSK